MYKRVLALFALFITFSINAQIDAEKVSSYALFEPNVGQWDEDFDFKLNLRSGALFFEDGGYSVRVLNPKQYENDHQHSDFGEEECHDHQSHAHHDEPTVPFEFIQQIAYRIQYEGANMDAPKTPSHPFNHHRNYFLGNDQSKWTSNVPLYSAIEYSNIYAGIDLFFYSKDDQFKYDFVVHPGGNPSQIVWVADGTDMSIQEGQLHYAAPFGDVVEWHPVAYQVINERRVEVEASFQLINGKASFDIGAYDANFDLIIDPVVVFATFSGSTADNWGFTATYDLNGGLYGAGITFGVGYPTTLGVYDRNFTDGPIPGEFYIDATISKFSPDGKTLLYATYLGGTECDQPHSMIVNNLGQLVVYGVTGSANFPTTNNAAYSTFKGGPVTYPFRGNSANNYFYRFPQGTDAYVTVFTPNGSALVGSTFLGGTGREAINTAIQRNYGDGSRGEVIVDDQNNIYVATTTFSNDYPIVNTNVGGNSGGCDAGVTKFSPNVATVLWSTMFGGTGDDQGYSIALGSGGTAYIAGGTNSNILPGTATGFGNSYNSNIDGYVARFDINGNLMGSTYIGTGSYDQAFLIDTDKNNAVYVFGQSLGNYPKTPGVWSSGAPRQFIHKMSPNLSQSVFSTAFGRSSGSAMSLVPTAFNVDDCLNILLSGWGGNVNSQTGFVGGNTRDLPITSDATQSNTDGSDFYFMSLSANASSLSYATYFGGGSVSEHVDGGTSRFSPDGQIYQAVCAGCGGSNSFPVTAGSYSTQNRSGNCNLGTVKFNFDVIIDAAADVNYTTDVDTVCNTLNVQFTNTSRNANVYEWDFGNGQTSNLAEPSAAYTQFGTYNIRLVAIDTICDISDTAFLQIEHDQGIEPTADFEIEYTVCDQSRTVYITNNSRRATNYIWSFGNGDQRFGIDPLYSYPAEGQFVVQLIAVDSVCDKYDTARVTVNFVTDIPPPIVNVTPSNCQNGKLDVWYLNDSSYYQYRWEWEDGNVEWSKFPNSKVPYSGTQVITLQIVDTVCNQQFDYEFTLDVTRLDNRVYIPNAFSPNSDGVNDVLLLKGNTCLQNTRFIIFNRWGQEVFKTDRPFSEFWNGRFNDGTLKMDTYVYRFYSEDGEKTGYITIIP